MVYIKRNVLIFSWLLLGSRTPSDGLELDGFTVSCCACVFFSVYFVLSTSSPPHLKVPVHCSTAPSNGCKTLHFTITIYCCCCHTSFSPLGNLHMLSTQTKTALFHHAHLLNSEMSMHTENHRTCT